ncbi:MAG: Gfo/Idh/MocA family oxidoreductase [Acidobacteria bacterium]|nr:Gfo/Idh/MocA family oxidoreductase [Acidobacteriota bacterium]MBS1865699.1 Gfo/Idh/MocA family oxidoreductase [Acidobacteriota bacterium]
MKKDFSRRQFLQRSAGFAGAAAISPIFLKDPNPIPPRTMYVPPSDRVRFAMIGVGMQGSGLLAGAVTLPGVDCVGAADLWDGRHTLAKEITGNPNLFTTRKYKELLDRKDIDCIVAAVPDHWHKRVVVDATAAGKDIYCEKPMSHTAAEGVAMVEAQKKTGRIVQIGSQRVSSAVCAKAKEMIAAGAIGKVTLIEGTLGRNDPTGAWEYPPPPGLSLQNFDWDTWQSGATNRPWDADMSPKWFARWRCWKEYGTGVAGDLLVHLVSGMNFMMGWNEPPKKVMALGGIIRFPDGRNMPDVHAALYEYASAAGAPVYLRLNLGCENPEIYRFQGSKGILEVTEFGLAHYPQTGEDSAPSYYTSGYPQAMREAYFKEWHKEHDPEITKEPSTEILTLKTWDFDDMRPHLWTFFSSVKSRKPLTEDAVFGHNAALACHMANESYFRGGVPVTWDAATSTIKS